MRKVINGIYLKNLYFCHMQKNTTNIRFLSIEKLELFLQKNNHKVFRAKQIYEWLWKKSARTFDEMTNISKDLRQLLKDNFVINALEINSVQKSKDSTIKTLFSTYDGNLVEGVLIPTKKRMTACISSQVGCNLDCNFCATGKIGFKRNLYFDEIYDQLAIISKQAIENYNIPVSNIVYMGMGEPLLNYKNVLKSIEMITSPNALAMSPSRITVSTVGIPKMITKLGDDNVKFNLAFSLHTANEKKRNSIIPISKNESLKDITFALKDYHSKTNNRISIEYILFKDFNDSLEDAKELAEFCKSFPVKINIIEYNNVKGSVFQKSETEKMDAFIEFLETKNLIVNVRRSRGQDIDAACGQLANTNLE